tara:strand:- start:2190 stop:2726 length:537 start_codon:yes stop_codon:yes gene_type:complete
MIKNRFDTNCSACGIPVSKNEGWAMNNADTGGKWKNFCKDHAPKDAPTRTAPKEGKVQAVVAKEGGLMSELRANGHICKLQGKEFVLYSGLLWLAHKNGLQSMETKITYLNVEGKEVVVQCTASGERGTFTAHGDAFPDNVSRGIAPSFLRMAETRACARSLRSYLGIGMCTAEELPS